jgi:hypothetical protein
MPDHIMVLGFLRSLYKDRETCTIVENMGGFSLSDSHFLHRGNCVIDFFGENVRREVVGHTFSSGTVESWNRGCAHPPSLGVEACEVGAWLISGPSPHCQRGWRQFLGVANCSWFLAYHALSRERFPNGRCFTSLTV